MDMDLLEPPKALRISAISSSLGGIQRRKNISFSQFKVKQEGELEKGLHGFELPTSSILLQKPVTPLNVPSHSIQFEGIGGGLDGGPKV